MPDFEAFDLNDETLDEHETNKIRFIKNTALFYMLIILWIVVTMENEGFKVSVRFGKMSKKSMPQLVLDLYYYVFVWFWSTS